MTLTWELERDSWALPTDALVIESILPDGVAAAEAFAGAHVASLQAEAHLFPDEEATFVRSVEKRSREFAIGRMCARRALAQLSWPAVAIPRGPHGEPRWPAGLVGSITHCDRYCAATVASSGVVATLGIDAEPNEPLPDGVLDLISTAEERARLWRLPTPTSRCAGTGCCSAPRRPSTRHGSP